MGKFTKTSWLFGLALVLILLAGVRYFSAAKTSTPSLTPTSDFPQPSITPSIIPSATPSVTLSVNPSATSIPSGPPNGQIVCDYQIPVGPTSNGTAVIRSTWKNITVGKNGSFRASVCVSVGGQAPSLMSRDNLSAGARDTTVPWLAPNVNYAFLLTDDSGGDLANCSGRVLSSCQINTHLPPVQPTRPPRP